MSVRKKERESREISGREGRETEREREILGEKWKRREKVGR